MTGSDRRGEGVALLGFLLSMVAAAALFVLAISTGSNSAWGACFMLAGTLGIWILNWVQLHQQRLVREEAFEVAELERVRREKLGGAQTIFGEDDLDQMEKLAMGRRLRSIERFLVPTIAMLTALYYAVAGIVLLSPLILTINYQPDFIASNVGREMLAPKVLLFFCGGIAFGCFMVSRYALGMSKLREWSELRAGGDAMFGASVVNLAVAIGCIFVISKMLLFEEYLAYAIGFMLLFLAFESVVNFVLELYRPKVLGQIERPFYDSRVLGIFSEPGGMIRKFANTIDYQFGFKVSETWFYKLLGRAVLPLLLVQAAVIFGITCFVTVPAGSAGVVEHNGLSNHYLRVVGPGLHFAWPWPIDRATIIPIDRIRRMEIGHEPDTEKERLRKERDKPPVLWTKQHWSKEYQLLVADKRASDDTNVPVNLLSMNVPVQWCVKSGSEEDVLRFNSQADDVEEIIEAIAYHELTRYVAQADILDLLGEKGRDASRALHTAIQEAVDRAGYDGKGLGVKIVVVGLGGVHPPPDEQVAETYEGVVSAYETRDATIKKAQGEAAEKVVRAGGVGWETLYDVIAREDEAADLDAGRVTEVTQEVERLLRTGGLVGGEARRITAMAERYAMDRVFSEMANSERYEMQQLAFDVAPGVYKLRVYLRMMADGMPKMQKYIVAIEEASRVIYEISIDKPGGFDSIAAELQAMDNRQ